MTSSPTAVPIRFVPARPSDVERHREPVTFGVPLPRGLCHADDQWQIVGAADTCPAQCQPMDRWPDGSVRWLLVDAQVSAGAAELVRTATVDQQIPFSVHDTSGRIQVQTGGAEFAFGSGEEFPCRGIALRLEGHDQLSYDIASSAARVTRTGPVRTTVEVHGAVQGDGPLRELELRATIDLFANSGAARISLTIRNPRAAVHAGGFWDLGDPGSLYVRQMSLTARTGGGAKRVAYSTSPESAMVESVLPLEIYQDSSGGANWQSPNHITRERRVPTSFRGFRLRSGDTEEMGLRASPVAVLAAADGETAIAVENFWQNFPKAIAASEGCLTASLFPSQFSDVHELQGGEQKTHVVFVNRGADTVTDIPLDWTRNPLAGVVDSQWIVQSEAVPWLAADDESHRALIWSAIEGADTFEHKREVVDQFGWRNFGDVYGDHEGVRHKGPSPLVSHYNNQYDVVAGFLYQYFRSGDVRWWTMARELARHVIDIDIYHTVRDKWSINHGLFWHTYHYGDADTATHRTYPRAGKGETHGGGPSPDQNYTTGLLLYYFLTGDETARETVHDLAQFVIDADDGTKTVFRWLSRSDTGLISASGSYRYHGPGRGPANSLNALIDGHRLTGDARFLLKAESLIRRVVHPAEDIARHELDDPENKWFYLMFLQALGKFLVYKADLGQLDQMYAYGQASLLHYTRWMADHEYPYLEKPERLTFPTETWAAHEIRKSDVFYLAALHSSDQERERLVERGAFFFRNSVETLAQKATRTLARPVIVLLSSGLLHPWFAANRGAQAPAAPELAVPPRNAFVPQRQVAMRRASVLAAAVGLLVLGGFAAGVYLLMSSS